MNCIFSEFVGKFYTRIQEKENVSAVTIGHWVVPYRLFKMKRIPDGQRQTKGKTNRKQPRYINC